MSFYQSFEFGNSPSNVAFVSEGVGVVPTDAITGFLEGLVVRPYTLTEGPLRFGAQDTQAGPTPLKAVSITNAGFSALEFAPDGCRLEGPDRGEFQIASCPLAPALAAGASRVILLSFDPHSDGLKSAILEIHPAHEAPSGIDLFGVGGPLAPPPELVEIVVDSGSVDGGDAVTLTGANFADGATVTIGGTRAGFIKVLGSTVISARTGAHPRGTVDVVVTNPDGQTATLANAYTYVAAPGRQGASP